MHVGEEEEVWSRAFGHVHGTGDGADAGAQGGEQTDLEAVDGLVEVGDLFRFRGRVVPFFGHRGVGVGVYFGLGEWFWQDDDELRR